MKRIFILLLITGFLSACNNAEMEQVVEKETISSNEYMVLATNWYQQSAEMRKANAKLC